MTLATPDVACLNTLKITEKLDQDLTSISKTYMESFVFVLINCSFPCTIIINTVLHCIVVAIGCMCVKLAHQMNVLGGNVTKLLVAFFLFSGPC